MQVTTESELLERSEKLEQALQENTLLQFCGEKADACESDNDKQIWSFLKVCQKILAKHLTFLGNSAHNISYSNTNKHMFNVYLLDI